MFCGSSSWCRGLVFIVWLLYFLFILTYFCQYYHIISQLQYNLTHNIIKRKRKIKNTEKQSRHNIYKQIYKHFYHMRDGRHTKSSQNATSHIRVSKGATIRNRYNQVPHLTQDTNWKVTNSQLDTANESQEVSSFPAGDHKAKLTDAHKGITNTRQKNINDPQKKYRLGTVSKIFYWRA